MSFLFSQKFFTMKILVLGYSSGLMILIFNKRISHHRLTFLIVSLNVKKIFGVQYKALSTCLVILYFFSYLAFLLVCSLYNSLHKACPLKYSSTVHEEKRTLNIHSMRGYFNMVLCPFHVVFLLRNAFFFRPNWL